MVFFPSRQVIVGDLFIFPNTECRKKKKKIEEKSNMESWIEPYKGCVSDTFNVPF